MHKVLKFNLKDQDIYFCSDTHFFHQRDFIWQARGFGSPEDHTNKLIQIINETVKPTGILFHLGDFCLNTTEERFESILARINCQNIYLLWGNHNSQVWKTYKRELAIYLHSRYGEDVGCNISNDIEIYPFKYKNITFLGDYQEVIINGQIIIMNHYSLRVWNHMSKGSWMLSGHSHNSDKERLKNCKLGKCLDIGVDGQLKPYSFEEIRKIMNYKEIESVDHHAVNL